MQVVLFKSRWYRPKDILISLFTFSNYVHAGLILSNGENILDASESRGNVDYGKFLSEHESRQIEVYDLGPNIKAHNYALIMIGSKYDWKGVIGWPFGWNDPKTVYCFEFVLQVMQRFNTINGESVAKIFSETGLDRKLNTSKIDSEDIVLVLSRAGLKPVYEGRADGFKA